MRLNTFWSNCGWLMNWPVGSKASWLTHGATIRLNQWLIAKSVVSYFFYFSSASLCCTDPSSFILSSAITSLLLGDIRDIFCWVVVVLKVSSGQKSLYCMSVCVCVGDYCTHSTVHTHTQWKSWLFFLMPDKCRIQHLSSFYNSSLGNIFSFSPPPIYYLSVFPSWCIVHTHSILNHHHHHHPFCATW